MIDDADIERQARNALAPKLQRVANMLAARVRAAAPKGKTGKLARSVRAFTSPEHLTAGVAVDEFYARFLEYGFRHRIGKKNRKRKGKLTYSRLTREQIAAGEYKQVDARPFARPAILAALPEVIAIFEEGEK